MENLTRFDPFERDPFEEALGGLLPTFFQPVTGRRREPSIKFDVWETEDAYLVSAEVPGVRKEDLQVSLSGNQVSIAGEQRKEVDVKAKAEMLLNERRYGKMQRTIALPLEIDESSAQARHADGVLHLTLPKKASSLAKRIEIR
jgi:HSP20 family protein